MILKKDCKYDIMTVTSMGIRITPINRQPVNVSNLYEMQATSAESNVLNISSALGLRAKVLTKFVKDSPIALFIKGELRKRNIEFEGKDIEQGDPWGYRHQFNIADSGYGVRGPRVLNDRAGEVGRTLDANDFDLDRIFGQEGCRILHLSGLIAALSAQTSKCCLDVALAAKKYGTVISFDLNYRASFWKGREKQLREIFTKIASISDILIGNEEDFQLALGVEGPEAGGKAISKTDAFKDMITKTSAKFKNVSVFANTLRQVENANSHLWGAIIYAEGNWYAVEPREIPVLDRIGGGDGFVGGLLYGILKEWEPEKWVQFAWASGALVTTLMTDYGQPADEDVIWSIYKGNARVKR
ncbi:MAG TPA: sugar kinase [Clostridia bacterium]|nr:MAG: 2-dehydro-3-deoxygluconokinase [Firmicutes bacterium ADurb.Bin146]HOD92669.1 sugar kinase [Clostridia bacterium]HQM39827.1 sugar kinase [Clostridia bacterium]